MNLYIQTNVRRFKGSVWTTIVSGTILVAMLALGGCGGAYHNPTTGSMPGQQPRTYPAHRR